LVVDDYLRTTARNIWACGDCIGRNLWTHAAEHEAKIAMQNALLPLKKKLDNRVTPWTTFLDPEVAGVGLTEAEARDEYSDIKVYRSEFKTLDRAIIEGETQGFCKIVCTASGRIIGAHIVGASAGELIHPLVAAVRDGVLVSEFAETMHVYPTLSEIAHRIGNDSYRELLENKTVKWALDKLV
jgi:pyruvate/2-oxoglutarate dehydrogenase complex dihydrolipoamide dehydrogenase (E3) component